MAGRGLVEPQQHYHRKNFSINKRRRLFFAKEPLHFYERPATWFGCSCIWKTLIGHLRITFLFCFIPTAVVGVLSVNAGRLQHRNVRINQLSDKKFGNGKQIWSTQGFYGIREEQ